MASETIRVGVVGLRRGQTFMSGATELVGLKLVAICDSAVDKLRGVGEKYNVATYSSYDHFLEHDMDAVVLANYFHEHAPAAIKALAAGKHVMSETASNATLAEGVALCRAVEKSGKIYMLAENYPYFVCNMEMRRLYEAGEIGEVTYAEGEYNHPMPSDMFLDLSPGPDHWRKWIPSTYYCTHGLAPLMCITGRMPIKVNALSIACREPNELMVRQGDPGSVILCRMDNGSVFRLFGLFLPGHSIEYRVHGSGGAMETVRGTGQLRVWHEEWNCPEGSPTHRIYMPEWPSNAQMASVAGHGGGDFWTSFEFAKAIRTGEQPFLDVYRGVAMSSVGVLAWKSALADGAPFDMPDFRCEKARQAYVDDAWSPFPSHSGPGQPPPSIRGPLLK